VPAFRSSQSIAAVLESDHQARLKAFRPPGIRAYTDLAINKPPAPARVFPSGHSVLVAIRFPPPAWTWSAKNAREERTGSEVIGVR
jgi:hypothetical protein